MPKTPLQDLESSAGPDYQCLAKTSASSGGKGHGWCTTEKRREGGVEFGPRVYGGSKGQGVTVVLFGREATLTGRGFVQELYEESVTGSTISLLWAAWWMDLGDLRRIWQGGIISTDGSCIPDVHSV